MTPATGNRTSLARRDRRASPEGHGRCQLRHVQQRKQASRVRPDVAARNGATRIPVGLRDRVAERRGLGLRAGDAQPAAGGGAPACPASTSRMIGSCRLRPAGLAASVHDASQSLHRHVGADHAHATGGTAVTARTRWRRRRGLRRWVAKVAIRTSRAHRSSLPRRAVRRRPRVDRTQPRCTCGCTRPASPRRR